MKRAFAFTLIEVLAAACLLAAASVGVVVSIRLAARVPGADQPQFDAPLPSPAALQQGTTSTILYSEDRGNAEQPLRVRWIAVDADDRRAVLRLISRDVESEAP